MPCTAGGRPVMIDMLFGLVKLGIAESAVRLAPSRISRAKFGARPASIGRRPLGPYPHASPQSYCG